MAMAWPGLAGDGGRILWYHATTRLATLGSFAPVGSEVGADPAGRRAIRLSFAGGPDSHRALRPRLDQVDRAVPCSPQLLAAASLHGAVAVMRSDGADLNVVGRYGRVSAGGSLKPAEPAGPYSPGPLGESPGGADSTANTAGSWGRQAPALPMEPGSTGNGPLLSRGPSRGWSWEVAG